jgi:D-alanyl-D-alanine carboxypeptidase
MLAPAGLWKPGAAGASPLWSPATTTADLSLRAGPGTGYEVISVMPKGSQVSALTEEPQNGFVRVRYGGREGWAAAAYLATGGGDDAPASATTTVALNLRAGPGTTHKVVLVMPAGSAVTLTGESTNGFAAVAYKGTYGWAYEAYLRR